MTKGRGMRRDYVIRRFVQFVIVLWGAATLNFLLPRMAPGNPVRERLLSALATGGLQQAGIEDMVRAYNTQFGLDMPIWDQYMLYLWNIVHFNFGYSISQYPAQVLPLILRALPWTIGLLLTATILSFTFGTLLGAIIAWPRSGRFFQQLVIPMMGLSSIPYYLLGLLLVYFFGVVVPIFPLSGGYSVGVIPALSWPFVIDVVSHAALPALSIVLAAIGFSALGMRGMMVTTRGEDYMAFAEAKGLSSLQ